jgi:hypothetical protein
MPTYSRDPGVNTPVFVPMAQNVGYLRNVISMATSDLVANATFDIGRLPAGARVLDMTVAVTDMDNGTAGTISIGDSGSVARFIQNASIQTAGVFRAGNNATSAATFAAHTPYTTETLIYGTVTTAPATAVAGTITVTILYGCEA